MISERMNAASIAGIELARQQIKVQHGRIVERSYWSVDGTEYIRLDEIREARPHLLFIGTAHNANIFLAGYMDAMEEMR
jgi:hypothetical protein